MNPITIAPTNVPITTNVKLTAEQVTALITLLASANPPIINLPAGKTFADILRLCVTAFPRGDGTLEVTIK